MNATRNRKFSLATGVIALLLAACSPSVNPSNSPTDSETPTPTPTPTTAAMTLYFVGDTKLGLRLYPETDSRTLAGGLALSALRQLVDEQVEPLDPDYTNLWASGDNAVNSLTVSSGDATIDLRAVHLNVGSEGEALAIDQLVWTAFTADPTIERVRFTVDGAPVESFAGHVDTTGWFPTDQALDALANIEIDFPKSGQSVSSPVIAKGFACTFEAAVPWRLLRDGKVVKSGSALAAGGCPTRGEWTINLGDLDAGIYLLRVMELSAKDGSLLTQDTKTFIVQ